MGLSAVTYALAKKYTDDTVIGLGGIKGAPCKVKSVTKTDGRSVVTLEWEGDDGSTETSQVYVNDGVSIWVPGRQYAVNDIVVSTNELFICTTANSDLTFDRNKWSIIVSNDKGDYYIIDATSELPSDLTSEDRRVYYCIEDSLFYLWNGINWSIISSGGSETVIREVTENEYNALTPEEQANGALYFVNDLGEIYLHRIVYGSHETDYSYVTNKPRINNVTLNGNKSTADLDLVDGTTVFIDNNGKIAVADIEISNSDIDDLFDDE